MRAPHAMSAGEQGARGGGGGKQKRLVHLARMLEAKFRPRCPFCSKKAAHAKKRVVCVSAVAHPPPSVCGRANPTLLKK